MKSRKQAIAIGLSKARKAGAKVPKKKTYPVHPRMSAARLAIDESCDEMPMREKTGVTTQAQVSSFDFINRILAE